MKHSYDAITRENGGNLWRIETKYKPFWPVELQGNLWGVIGLGKLR